MALTYERKLMEEKDEVIDDRMQLAAIDVAACASYTLVVANNKKTENNIILQLDDESDEKCMEELRKILLGAGTLYFYFFPHEAKLRDQLAKEGKQVDEVNPFMVTVPKKTFEDMIRHYKHHKQPNRLPILSKAIKESRSGESKEEFDMNLGIIEDYVLGYMQ